MASTEATFAETWKQRRNQIGVWWDKLSDNDVDQIAGRYDRLISTLQARYGFSQAQAQAEVTKLLQAQPPAPGAPESPVEQDPSRGKEPEHGI